MGAPDQIMGAPASMRDVEPFTLTASRGTIPNGSERGAIAVGSAIAREYRLHVGDTFTIRSRPSVVKAILKTTMIAPDQTVDMSLADAQELYRAALPPTLRHNVQASQIVSVLNVCPAKGVSGDTLATRLTRCGLNNHANDKRA